MLKAWQSFERPNSTPGRDRHVRPPSVFFNLFIIIFKSNAQQLSFEALFNMYNRKFGQLSALKPMYFHFPSYLGNQFCSKLFEIDLIDLGKK